MVGSGWGPGCRQCAPTCVGRANSEFGALDQKAHPAFEAGFDAEPEEGRCIITGELSHRRVLFAKAY